MSDNSPVTFDKKMFWGEHKFLQYEIENGQGVLNAWLLEWTLWESREKVTQLITKGTGSGVSVLDNNLGLAQVTLNADDWDDIEPNTSYYYELWRVDTGAEQVLAFGEFYVR